MSSVNMEMKNVEEQLEDPKKNKSSVYQMLSNKLQAEGFDKTSIQCKISMHTIKRTFWDCKNTTKTEREENFVSFMKS